MLYKKTVKVKKTVEEHLSKYLKKEPNGPEECLKETVAMTVPFENGFKMKISVRPLEFWPGESNLAWSEASLIRNGKEIAHTDPDNRIYGEWELKHGIDTYKTVLVPF